MMAHAFQLLNFCRNVCPGKSYRLSYSSLRNFFVNAQDGIAPRIVSSSISREKTFSRAYSTSPSAKSEDKPVKLSYGRRFLNALKLLALGSKLTVSDARKMFSLRREAKKSGFDLLSGKAPLPEDVVLTRAELSFIIQVRKDFSKCLPVIILFFIPFIGYSAVPLMLLYPHKVLSRQFLTPKIDKKYKALDYDQRLKSASVFANKLCHHNDKLAYLLGGTLTTDTFMSIHNMFQDNGQFKFQENRLLSSSFGHFSYLPSYFLTRRLRRHMYYMYMEDWLINLEGGVSTMTAEEIEQACYNRGLLADSDVHPSGLGDRLEQWVQYSTSFSECPATTLAITSALATAMK